VLEKLQADYPGVSFTMTRSLGEGEFFIPQVADRIRENVPGLWVEASGISNAAGSIEPLSMEIIDRLLPDTTALAPGEKAVLKRVIHAGGDPQLANLVRFGPGAAAAGIAALRKRCPVFTDVRMAAAGISASLTNALGCTVMCALDETDSSNGQPGHQTRAAKAIRHLGAKLNGAVVAIGNAPTALLALLDLIESQGIKPALVIGMPVGFVQAAESKEALIQRFSHYITISGTRGGSPLAAATVNALLKSALQPDTTAAAEIS
jgi:precorrin-8X/cobalt-precorrin-8 methylmutase